MNTVYSDPIFIKSELLTSDGKNRITCTLKDQSGRYLADLLRNDSKGFCFGRLVDPPASPSWLVPGTVLHGTINGLKAVLTVEPKIQSRIAGLQNILGDAIHFSYVSVSEFNNSNNDTTNRISRC